jgi:hypothetical protein
MSLLRRLFGKVTYPTPDEGTFAGDLPLDTYSEPNGDDRNAMNQAKPKPKPRSRKKKP